MKSKRESLAPEAVKRTQSKWLNRCDLCGSFVSVIVGLKIPDPTKFDEYPTSFSYVCPECYEKFSNLKTEIENEAEKKLKELKSKMDPEDDEYEKVMNIMASGRMTTGRRKEVMKYIDKVLKNT